MQYAVRLGVLWAVASVGLSGCRLDHIADHLFDGDSGLGDALGDAIAQSIRQQPARSRATLLLECDHAPTCKDHKGHALATTCTLHDDGWKASFATTFAACSLRCDTEDCYLTSLAAEAVDASRGSEVTACRDSLARCPETESDACDALNVLSSETTIAAIANCHDAACADLVDCYQRAVLTR